jgi:hypothetical protein
VHTRANKREHERWSTGKTVSKGVRGLSAGRRECFSACVAIAEYSGKNVQTANASRAPLFTVIATAGAMGLSACDDDLFLAPTLSFDASTLQLDATTADSMTSRSNATVPAQLS